MLLNYQHHQPSIQPSKGTLVFIHGLFGSLSNLGMLSRAFEDQYEIVQIDLRNHGDSMHDMHMNYELMAQDVIETLDSLNIQSFIVIGHSMGAKVAMKMAALIPSRILRLVILDMAPVAYTHRQHNKIIEALKAVEQANVKTRKEATDILQAYINELGVIQFLLKSFSQGHWKFNVASLAQNYDQIISWENIPPFHQPVLFLKGENSSYISIEEHINSINAQFPLSTIMTIQNAGHWLHAEQTIEVLNQIKRFFQS